MQKMPSKFQGGGWIGVDPIAMMLGGNNNKIKAFGTTLNGVATFVKTVNTVNKLISTYVDLANNFVLNSQFGINPLKTAGQVVINTAKTSINDLRGSGIYFLDMNKGVPPIYLLGQTATSINLKGELQQAEEDLRIEQANFDSKYVDDTAKGDSFSYQSDLAILNKCKSAVALVNEKITNVQRTTGGTYQYLKTYVDSLDDERDYNRPQLSTNGAVGVIYLMIGSSNLNNFLKSYEGLKSLLYSSTSNQPIGMLDPVKNLTVKYIHNESIDNKYNELKSYYDKGTQAYQKNGSSDLPHASIININLNTGEIEEVKGIRFDDKYVTEAKAAESKTNSPNVRALEYLMAKKVAIYKDPFPSNSGVTVYSYRRTICVLNKEEISKTGLSADYMTYSNDSLYYHPNRWVSNAGDLKKIWEVMPDTRCEIYDSSEAAEMQEGDAVLTWDYPKTPSFINKLFGGVTYKIGKVYVIRKKITRDNFKNDLKEDILNGIKTTISFNPTEFNSSVFASQVIDIPDSNDTLQMIVLNSYNGLRKVFWDFEAIEDADTAKEDGIWGYEYAMAYEYTAYMNIKAGISTLQYPIFICAFNEQFAEQEKELTISAREDIIDTLTEGGDSYALSATADELIKRFGDPSEIDVRPVTYSNIGKLVIPSAYDFVTATPPDWASIKIGDLIPSISVWLDRAEKFLEVFLKSLEDFADAIPALTKEFKAKMDSYTNTLLEIAGALTKVIENLSKISIGAYVMSAYCPSGGTEITKKILSLSLTEELGDYGLSDSPNGYLKLQTGAPPFGKDDYVGGYCILIGGSKFTEVSQLKDFIGKYFGTGVSGAAVLIPPSAVPIVRNKPIDFNKIKAMYETQNGSSGEIQGRIVPDKADTIARLNEGLNNLNNGDTPKLAANLANGGTVDTAGAGLDLDNVKNYDGTDITDASFLKFKAALKAEDSGLLSDAAASLRSTQYRIPSNTDLFQNPEDATAYNNFKLELGQAMMSALLGLGLDETLIGASVSINPYDNIEDINVSVLEDNYQIGWNAAVYYTYDPRNLVSKGYNDSLEAVSYNDLYDGYCMNEQHDSQGYNDEWEALVYNV